MKIIVIAVVAAAVAGGGVAGVLLMGKKGGEHDAEKAHVEAPKPPTFHPLDTFTVNLADRERERFLQANITLQVKDEKVIDKIKAFNPTLRNHILLVMSSQNSEQLSTIEGKEKLARAIVTIANRTLGFDSTAEGDKAQQPVTAALFSSIVIQ